MTGSVATEEIPVISPAPQRVRLSFLCERSQLDVALPLDVPIVGLIPQLTKLAGLHEASQADASDDPSAAEAKNNIWVLRRRDGKSSLQPEVTLREAGVAEGELLRLTAARALSAPTLYDDVVDAAARLNKGAYPGWDATAARWMAFVGVYLTSGAWMYLLVAHALTANRAALAGLSMTAALMLAAAAALANRRYAQRDIGTALGWAALPITAAVAWVTLRGMGGYGIAAAFGAMVVISVVLFRSIGTGHWGYLAVEVISALGGLAFVVHTAGLRADLVGAGMALAATLGCLAVPALTTRFARVKLPLRDAERDDVTSADVSTSPRTAGKKQIDTVTSPAGESVWARMQSETLTRSALYTGLGVSTGLGALTVLTASGPVQWPGMAFALGCAVALGLHTQAPVTAAERAGLAIPAVVLAVSSCVLAQRGNPPMPMTAFGALLVTNVLFAAIGVGARPGRLTGRTKTLLAYLNYLTISALIPLAWWAVDAYGSWGVT